MRRLPGRDQTQIAKLPSLGINKQLYHVDNERRVVAAHRGAKERIAAISGLEGIKGALGGRMNPPSPPAQQYKPRQTASSPFVIRDNWASVSRWNSGKSILPTSEGVKGYATAPRHGKRSAMGSLRPGFRHAIRKDKGRDSPERRASWGSGGNRRTASNTAYH